MNLFITGVHGFLGSHLARHWAVAGHRVSGADVPGAASAANAALNRSLPFRLQEDLPAQTLCGEDLVLHLAYDRQASISVNVEGTRRVCRAAEAAGVRRQIFVSSCSARPGSLSAYGRLKYELETFFLNEGHTVVRPGLVIGNGGLFGRNMEKILGAPVMPLLDGGKDLLPVIAMEDLAAALTVLHEGRRGAFNLFDPELPTMRRFVETINRAAGHRAVYVSISAGWAVVALTLIERLGVRLPVDIDNLRGLQQSQGVMRDSDLSELIPGVHSFEETIAKLIDARRS